MAAHANVGYTIFITLDQEITCGHHCLAVHLGHLRQLVFDALETSCVALLQLGLAVTHHRVFFG